MNQRRAALAIFIAACAGFWACDSNQKKPPKHRLEGSLTEFMAFGYDEVRYESTAGASDFAFSFIRFRGEDLDGGTPAGEDVPLKVTVRTGNLSAEQLEALDFDLAADAGNGGIDQTGVLSRNILNDPRRSFTTLVRGGLKINRIPQAPGEICTGEFHATFDPGIEVSSGRTLFGSFTAYIPEP